MNTMLVPGILLFLLVLILVSLLLNPFVLHLDTRQGIYSLGWWGMASAHVTGSELGPVLRIWMLGWRKQFSLLDLMGPSPKAEKKKPEKKKKRSGWKRPRWFTFRLGLRILRTFRVREFRLHLDTGDFVRNAYWWPVFYILSGRKGGLSINFQGENELVLIMSNRLWDVAWVFLTGFISPKNNRS
jgi:hypothetical protein